MIRVEKKDTLEMNNLAPIVLFVYNRLDHTKQTIEALQKNDLANESILYIYSDASKNVDSVYAVDAVRHYIEKVDGFKEIKIIYRDENFGLAKSIVDGVTRIVNQYGKVIVLEDDLVTSPFFLEYMNRALEKYAKESTVYSITGYSFTDNDNNISDDTYFLPLTSSWSWATWDDKWKYFSRDEEGLRKNLSDRQFRFDFNFSNAYPYVKLAKKQLQHKSDSWAIFWYYSVFKQNGLTLYPNKKLVKNIGHDGSGTHCNSSKTETITVHKIPKLTENMNIKEEYIRIVQDIIKNEVAIRRRTNIKVFLKNFITKYFTMLIISRGIQLKNIVQALFTTKPYGENTYIDKSVQILGKSHIKIGNNTIVSEDSWLNVNHKDISVKHIVIGNNCYVGKRNFFSSGQQIVLGDYCMTGIDCKFLGSDHKFDNPMSPYITTGTTVDNVIYIGHNVWIGANVIVVGNVSIGHGSIIGAGSLVTKDIPPFSLVVGSPARVIKRYDFTLNEWISIGDFNLSSEELIPNEKEYLEALENKVPRIFLPLQASSRRFGDLV